MDNPETPRIRTPLDPFFQFPLGAEVTLQAMLTPFRWVPGQAAEAHIPQKLVILERQLLECPGGYQQSYHCRVFDPGSLHSTVSFTAALFWLNESELVDYPTEGGQP